MHLYDVYMYIIPTLQNQYSRMADKEAYFTINGCSGKSRFEGRGGEMNERMNKSSLIITIAYNSLYCSNEHFC